MGRSIWDPLCGDEALLAVGAAIAFDRAYQGIEYDNAEIDELAKRLLGFSERGFDRMAAVGLQGAFNKVSDREISRIDDLKYRVSLAAREMSYVSDLPKERLEVMRDLCTEIAKSSLGFAAAHRKYLLAA